MSTRQKTILLGIPLMIFALMFAGAEEYRLDCGNAILCFSRKDGSITRVVDRAGKQISMASAREGLFFAEGDDGSVLSPAGVQPAVRCDGKQMEAVYKKAGAVVRVTVEAGDGYADFRAEVLNGDAFTIKKFHLPGKLSFDPAGIRRLIMPDGGLNGVGFAFEPAFFREQSQRSPVAWDRRCASPDSYIKLFGGPLHPLDMDKTESVALTVTAEGKRIFPAELSERLGQVRRNVCRASAPGQYQLSLVDSPNGPFLCGSNFGGTGYFWRFGAIQNFNDTRKLKGVGNLFVETVAAIIADHAARMPERRKIVLFAMQNGPENGPMAATRIPAWREALQTVAEANGCTLEIAPTGIHVMELLADPRVLALVNPYGEAFPMPVDGPGPMLEAIRNFVRSGGYWFESGGYSFHWEYTPARYLSFKIDYPSAAADFQQLDGDGTGLGLYSVQPLSCTPWDRKSLLFSTTLDCGGGKTGGWFDRAFMVWIEPGESWRSPAVRMRFGSPEENLRAYCADNNLVRRLSEKMPPELLQRYKESVLFHAEGRYQYVLGAIDYLPKPTLVHLLSYMRAGFDRSYPDHLPFGEGWEKMPELLAKLKASGHLFMPYSNSSFWCETTPRPPTFAREGDAGLLRQADGSLRLESYGWGDHRNTGYTLTMWHPAVRAANDRTIRQFQTECPADILFQDQFGVRWNLYDFNAASPDRSAGYATGIINQATEDSRHIPIATEGGYAHLANAESGFYGMAFGLIPTKNRGSEQKDYHKLWPPAFWRVFPVAQYVMHDKAMMSNHNAVAFINSPEPLAWTLGMGFGIGYIPSQWGAFRVAEPEEQGWLRFLAAVQKHVVAPGVGEPLKEFEHRRLKENDFGCMEAVYGKVRILANLNPEALSQEKWSVAPHGFRAAGDGMRAGILSRAGTRDFSANPAMFVAAGNSRDVAVTVYAKQGDACAVELPGGGDFRIFALEDGRRIPCVTEDGFAFFSAPGVHNTPAACRNALTGTLE